MNEGILDHAFVQIDDKVPLHVASGYLEDWK